MNKLYGVKNLIGVVFLLLILRKILLGQDAMTTVTKCKHQIVTDQMTNNSLFATTVLSLSKVEPALILILNQHALNMTLNWLCNTVNMPGVHERALIVTLDKESDSKLAQFWPDVKRLPWTVECLSEPFNYGDGKYQLFYLFRANLAKAFLYFDRPFWMIQQDTFWRQNLLDLASDLTNTTHDIIFDRAAETKGSLIAGGYYLANPTQGARRFFSKLSTDLEWWYVPDNTYMTSLCSIKGIASCGQLPFSTVTNWIWLHEPSRLNGIEVPWLVQFDGDTKLGGKLAKMRSLGFYFLKDDGVSCNHNSVMKAQRRVVKWSGVSGSLDANGLRSYSHWQFGLYQAIIDILYQFSWTEKLLHRIIFPHETVPISMNVKDCYWNLIGRTILQDSSYFLISYDLVSNKLFSLGMNQGPEIHRQNDKSSKDAAILSEFCPQGQVGLGHGNFARGPTHAWWVSRVINGRMIERLIPLFLAVLQSRESVLRHEIRQWAEDVFLDCIFCMDYDDYKRMSIFGCTLKQPPTCKGNVCYMRQHKQGNYFLYTSGCLNLTRHQFENIHSMIDSPEIQPDRESNSATQLCEVTASINTCLCTNKLLCNNVSSVEPFTEYTIPIFTEVNFDEVAHFRYFLPDDPILESLQKTGPRDEYFLIKSVNHVSVTRLKYASGALMLTCLVVFFL